VAGYFRFSENRMSKLFVGVPRFVGGMESSRNRRAQLVCLADPVELTKSESIEGFCRRPVRSPPHIGTMRGASEGRIGLPNVCTKIPIVER
jgi:hypothetical protein